MCEFLYHRDSVTEMFRDLGLLRFDSLLHERCDKFVQLLSNTDSVQILCCTVYAYLWLVSCLVVFL